MSMSLDSIKVAVLFLGLVEFLLLHIFQEKKRIYIFFSGFSSSVQSNFIAFNDSRDHAVTEKGETELSTKNEKIVGQNTVCREDIELVLRSLGMFETVLPAKIDSNEIFSLFDEETPRREEVEKAFDVFDKNGDGLIDVKELQNVLCSLGLQEGSEIENCRKMIGVFDENGDGNIDFNEFVKFMESN